MKSILIVNQSSGYLMVDIANAFVNSGKYDQVVLMAGNPEALVGLDKNVHIEKMCKYNRISLVKRFLSWTYGSLQILFKVWFKYRSYELFLVSNPPTVSFVTLFCKNQYSTLIYDVYPDGLVSTGFVSNRNLLFKIWVKVTKRFYQKAQHVYTITEGMANRMAQYCERGSIEVVSVWYNSILNRIDRKENDFIRQNNLTNKFIIMYSGNIGKGHNVKLLVSIAERMKQDDEIQFVIIGEGWEKKIIQDLIVKKSLNNVLLLPYQPSNRLSYSLSAADLAYISVEDNVSTICVPSKTFNFIKLGTPLLCIAQEDAEIAKLIRAYEIGGVFRQTEIDNIVDFIFRLKNDKKKREEYKNNLAQAKSIFSPENSFKFIKD